MPGLKLGGGERINLKQVTNDKQCGIMHDKVEIEGGPGPPTPLSGEVEEGCLG